MELKQLYLFIQVLWYGLQRPDPPPPPRPHQLRVPPARRQPQQPQERFRRGREASWNPASSWPRGRRRRSPRYYLSIYPSIYLKHVKDALYVILWFLYWLSIEQLLFVIYPSISIFFLYIFLLIYISRREVGDYLRGLLLPHLLEDEGGRHRRQEDREHHLQDQGYRWPAGNDLSIYITSVSDPFHFDTDPDPRIRFRDNGSGSRSGSGSGSKTLHITIDVDIFFYT